MSKLRHIFCGLILLFSLSGKAQDTLSTPSATIFTPQFDQNKYYQIITKYGAQFRGRVINETEKDIVFQDRRGNTKHTIYKSDIKEVTPMGLSSKENISRFDDDYYSNYYMLAENVLPFKEGSFNATTHYLVENCNFAFSEHWAASVNIIFILPTSIGVKCTYPIGKDLHLGGNVFVWGLPGDANSSYYVPFMGASAKITKGDNNTNATLGAGTLLIKDFDKAHNAGRSSDYTPLYYVSFAYTNRFSKHGAFNVESFLFPLFISRSYTQANLGMTGVSIKWIRDTNVQWNFGCYGLYLGDLRNLNSKSKVIPLPYLSYSYFIHR
jgi:hypothetical protein